MEAVSVSVVIPWTGGCPHREAAFGWVTARYRAEHPNWEIVCGNGDTPDGYSRSRAILDGARWATGDTLVIADADVWCDPAEAVAHAAACGWAVPHTLIHRLSETSTRRFLAGEDWRKLPLSTDNRQDEAPYVGNPTGTLLAIRRDALETAPPDPRFVGWGQEDVAWGLALRTLVGEPWRGRDDLVHLWHPPQPRLSRVVGSAEGEALANRYRFAARSAETMRELIEEVTWTHRT